MKIKSLKKLAILAIFGLLTVSACKSQKSVTKTENNPQNMIELSDTSHYNILVSFFSIGSGIDFEVAKRYERFIKEFEIGKEKTLLVERIPWGREGELDYCIRFNGLSSADQKILIDRTKEIIAGSKWVNFSTDTPCKRKRK